jgi:glutaredoxin 3
MYTTRWCGYCVRAKTLLDSRGLDYEEISLDDDPAFRQTVLEATGGWTVPQILIDGRPIGGYTELWRLDREGRLDELLAARAGWHMGQNQVVRPATIVRAIGVPQRSHGSSRRP